MFAVLNHRRGGRERERELLPPLVASSTLIMSVVSQGKNPARPFPSCTPSATTTLLCLGISVGQFHGRSGLLSLSHYFLRVFKRFYEFA